MATNTISGVVWRISLPIIFVEATETLDHLIDTLFLARVGVTELGAIAVADAVMLLFLIPPLAIVDGIQILTARRLGQRRASAAGAVFNQGLLIVVLLSVASAVLLKLTSPLLAYWLVESEAVGAAVDGYLQLDAYSVPFAGVTFACSALLTSLGKTRALLPATALVVVIDVILNYLFIFGAFGFPELGMRGAAVGSIGAELAAAVYLVAHVWRAFDRERYGFFRFRGLDPGTTRTLGRMSAPIAAQTVLEDIRWFVFFLIIERVGTEALAIANIGFTCFIVFWIPTEGFSEAACSMVSRYAGQNHGHRIGAVLRSTTSAALLTTIPFIAIALLAPEWMVAAFSPDANLVDQASASLRVLALVMLVAIPAEMWFTAVVGTGDTTAALGIEFLLMLVMLGLTWMAAIYLAWSIPWVWLAVSLTWLVSLLASYGWIKSGIWKRLEV